VVDTKLTSTADKTDKIGGVSVSLLKIKYFASKDSFFYIMRFNELLHTGNGSWGRERGIDRKGTAVLASTFLGAANAAKPAAVVNTKLTSKADKTDEIGGVSVSLVENL